MSDFLKNKSDKMKTTHDLLNQYLYRPAIKSQENN